MNYQASSQDEVALVVAAKILGFFFHRRTTSSIIIRESHVEGLGCTQDVEYKILNVLEFNSSRKRQSLICVHPSGQLVLYCKGADTAIYERLENRKSPIALSTWRHLEKFASEGLRTLCVGYRFLDLDTYNSWNEKFRQARSALTDREEKLNQNIRYNTALGGFSHVQSWVMVRLFGSDIKKMDNYRLQFHTGKRTKTSNGILGSLWWGPRGNILKVATLLKGCNICKAQQLARVQRPTKAQIAKKRQQSAKEATSCHFSYRIITPATSQNSTSSSFRKEVETNNFMTASTITIRKTVKGPKN
eukprot:Gb_18234 [translate_table: standard]